MGKVAAKCQAAQLSDWLAQMRGRPRADSLATVIRRTAVDFLPWNHKGLFGQMHSIQACVHAHAAHALRKGSELQELNGIFNFRRFPRIWTSSVQMDTCSIQDNCLSLPVPRTWPFEKGWVVRQASDAPAVQAEASESPCHQNICCEGYCNSIRSCKAISFILGTMPQVVMFHQRPFGLQVQQVQAMKGNRLAHAPRLCSRQIVPVAWEPSRVQLSRRLRDERQAAPHDLHVIGARPCIKRT